MVNFIHVCCLIINLLSLTFSRVNKLFEIQMYLDQLHFLLFIPFLLNPKLNIILLMDTN